MIETRYSILATFVTFLMTSCCIAMAQSQSNDSENETNTSSPQTPPPVVQRPITANDIDQLRGRLVDNGKAIVLNRDEIGSLRDKSLDSQYANNRPGYYRKAPPLPRRRKLNTPLVQMEGAPTRLYLGQGIISAISLFDSRGRAWPIEEINFDPQMLMVNGNGCGEKQTPRDAEKGAERPHVVYVMPCKYWSWTNIVIKLENAPAPLIYQIESGSDQDQAIVDMAVDITVEGKTPAGKDKAAFSAAAADKSKTPTISDTFKPDSTLDDFLNAVPPKDARKIPISGDNNAEAWLYHGMLYLKTSGIVMNPAHDAHGYYNGMHVWRFDRPTPRIVAQYGSVERFLSVDY